MKTQYQVPEIEILQLYAEDVITSSLTTEDVYDEEGDDLQWGDLWD